MALVSEADGANRVRSEVIAGSSRFLNDRLPARKTDVTFAMIARYDSCVGGLLGKANMQQGPDMRSSRR